MTPEQKIKWLVIEKCREWLDDDELGPEFDCITEDNVDELYDQLEDAYSTTYDAMYEIREGEVETDIPSPYSRHLESKSVAAQAPDGTWVGWTYWYGGGKHAEPEAIDWISEAYTLDVVEEEKLVVVRTFTKVEE
jgi:hypothetical protein